MNLNENVNLNAIKAAAASNAEGFHLDVIGKNERR